VVVVMVLAVLFVVTSGALVVLGGRVIDHVRAQSLADSAALASLEGGRAAAEALTGRAGGELAMWTRGPGAHAVTVVVRLGDATATARATDEP
jgi:hypothetical protein